MDIEISPTAARFAQALLVVSVCSWLWIFWKLAHRQNPLPREPLPPWQWSLDAMPVILGFDGHKFLRDIALGVGSFVVSAFPVLMLQELLTQWFEYKHPTITNLLEHRDFETLVNVVSSAVIMAPIIEELLFRRLIQGTLEWLERLGNRSAENARPLIPLGLVPILISSLLFALAHWGQGAAPIPLFFLALILGFLHLQTHRIVPSIVAHMCLNAFSLALVWTATLPPPETPQQQEVPAPAVESKNAAAGMLSPVKSASSAAVNFDSLIA